MPGDKGLTSEAHLNAPQGIKPAANDTDRAVLEEQGQTGGDPVVIQKEWSKHDVTQVNIDTRSREEQ